MKNKCPQTPLVLYINGNGGLLERMKATGVDVIGLDWTVDMEDRRKRLGKEISVQDNVDPACLFSPLPALTEEIQRVVTKVSNQNFHHTDLGGLSLIFLCACHGDLPVCCLLPKIIWIWNFSIQSRSKLIQSLLLTI